jgi:citrate synthase
MAGAAEPLRADRRPEAVHRVGSTLIGAAVEALDRPSGGRPAAPLRLDDGRTVPDTLAGRLAERFTPAPTAPVVRALNAALVLLADHELATSTLAVRLAASTRADPFDAVLAGLGVLGGPLHGGASELVVELLTEAAQRGPGPALDGALRWRQMAPGFGQVLYPDGDPRATALLPLVDKIAGTAQRRVIRALVDVAAEQGLAPPNVDLALGALAGSLHGPGDAGHTVFTVARLAGWLAHYLEELVEPALRFRARAVYAAPQSPPRGP